MDDTLLLGHPHGLISTLTSGAAPGHAPGLRSKEETAALLCTSLRNMVHGRPNAVEISA
jgi:hypothetical protein